MPQPDIGLHRRRFDFHRASVLSVSVMRAFPRDDHASMTDDHLTEFWRSI